LSGRSTYEGGRQHIPMRTPICVDCYWHHHWADCPHRRSAKRQAERALREAEQLVAAMEEQEARWAADPCRCVGLLHVNERCPIPEHAERARTLQKERADALR
jgi:hypothetical protein